ncbi:lysosomal alpha-mannosidase-like isoform X1 [Chironomus tepperi]|uniref:lysosomal alpha-mannosidase-like isoform X1 n=1 Tax=Chironomus tepperi TaxID=113505 RepID=UPI00391FC602
MQRIILLTIISNLCLQCISHPHPSVQNVEIVDVESDGSNQSDNYERVFVKIAQNYRKINEKQKSSGHHDTSYKSSTNCGYESCPKIKPDMINVHLVAHTHDDVGWLKTVDQYYYGSKGLIQKAGVQYILDTVVQALLQDPSKRFIYVESAFFEKWWREQDDKLKEQVKMLVNEGRLEFIGGAWSMNDEATTHYQSIVDQFSWGLRFLNDTFGQCGRPRVGWQIDPFGHSREQASLFARMGFDGMFIGRLDYQDKLNRLMNKSAEMIWKSSANLDNTDLFTGVLYNNYGPPNGFCFDILCDDEPIIDDKHSPDYNVDRRVTEFVNYIKLQSDLYRTNNIILTMGGDFTYMDAHVYYKNLDKLIRYTNKRQADGLNVNLFYSTPSCYLKSLYDAGITWPTKTDDFFPYASDPHAYWTGYFSSRPTIKRFERVGNHYLQICKQLSATAKVQENFFDGHLKVLRMAMGIMQHHDAVTGTEKQHVANDYSRRLDLAIEACGFNIKSSLNQFVTNKSPPIPSTSESSKKSSHMSMVESNYWDLQFESCLNLNISICNISENSNQFMVTVYNPLAHATYQYVRMPVSGTKYEVRDYRNIIVPSQLVSIPNSVKSIDYRSSTSNNEIVFQATEVPAFGYKSYFVSRIMNEIEPSVIQISRRHKRKPEPVVIGNEHVNVTFDVNGLLSQICVSDGTCSKISQKFLYYKGAVGNNEIFENRSSGAYIFRPEPKSSEKEIAKRATIDVIKGEQVDEVHQTFNEWLSQVVRIYKTENFVEFEWLVGPIPIDDGAGKEIISRFYTVMKTDGVFYTDSNGREMLKRKRNHRDTWKVDIKEPVAGNYYPINTKIAIEDKVHRLAVLTDRAQGGSSLYDGTVELMIHRRLLHDDAFGVGEALNETAYGGKGLIARGKHYLIYGKKTNESPTLEGRERLLQNRVLIPNWLFFDDVSSISYDDWTKKYSNIHSSIGLSLPQNVYFMTFEPWKDGTFLIRFEHLLEKNEDPELSKAVRFNLTDVFPGYDIELNEVTLSANQWIGELQRLHFKSEGDLDDINLIDSDKLKPVIDMEITLDPMEMRTFVMTMSAKV